MHGMGAIFLGVFQILPRVEEIIAGMPVVQDGVLHLGCGFRLAGEEGFNGGVHS